MLINDSNFFKINFSKKINFKKIIMACYLLSNLNLFAENTTLNNVVDTNKKLEYFSVKSEEEKNKNNDQALGKNSIAIGPNAKTEAKAEASISLGYEVNNSNVGSTALGSYSNNSGNFGTILGYSSSNSQSGGSVVGSFAKNTGKFGTAISYYAENSGENGLVLGTSANNSGNSGSVIGYFAKNSGDDAIVFGTQASNSEKYGTVVGSFSKNSGKNGTIFGVGSENTGDTGMTLGYFSKNNGIAGISIGAANNNKSDAGISIGYKTINNGNQSIVLGSNAKNSNILSAVVGYQAENTGEFGTIFGTQSINSGLNGTVIGANSKNTADDAIVLGSNSENSAYKGIIIGSTLNNSADLGIILGNNSKNTQAKSIVLGTENNNTGLRGIVIGEKAINNGTLGIVLGQKSNNLGQFGVVIGHNSSNSSEGGVAIGETIKNLAPHSAVIGDFSKNSSKFSNVFGYNSNNSGESGLVLGSNANNKIHSAVALGSYSQTSRSRFSNPYNILSNSKETIILSFSEANIVKLKDFLEKNSPKKLDKFNKIIEDYDEKLKNAESDDKKLALMTKRRDEVNSIFSTWKSTLGSIAIGNEKTNQTRQITGLAAGTEDTDAVNIAQLKSLKQYVDDNNPFEYRDSNGNSLVKIGNNYYKKDGTKISDENLKNGIVISTKEGKIINNVKNPIENRKAINISLNSGIASTSNVVTEDSFKGKIISNTLQIINGENKILGNDDTKLEIELKNDSIENKHIKDGSISENKLDNDLKRKIVLSDLSKKEIYNKIVKTGAVNTAMSNLHPLSYNPLKPNQIMAALGINGGSTAIAIGLSHYFNEDSMLTGSASMSTFNKNNEFALGLGISCRLGSKKDNVQHKEKSIDKMQKEIQKLIEENKEKDKKIQELENKIEKILARLK